MYFTLNQAVVIPCKCKKLHDFSFYLCLSPLKNILPLYSHKTITADYSALHITLSIYVYLGVTILLVDTKAELNIFKACGLLFTIIFLYI